MVDSKVPRCHGVPNQGVVAPMTPWHLRFSGSQGAGSSSKLKQNRTDFIRFAIESGSEGAQNGPFEVLLRLKSTVLDAKWTLNRLRECVNCTARRTARRDPRGTTATRCCRGSKWHPPPRSKLRLGTHRRETPFRERIRRLPRLHQRVVSRNAPNAVRVSPGDNPRNGVSPRCVPKRSLGTRERGRGPFFRCSLLDRSAFERVLSRSENGPRPLYYPHFPVYDRPIGRVFIP